MARLILLLLPIISFAQLVPKDGMGTPIYGGIGYPQLFESVTLTTSSYVALVTLPTVGSGNTQRQFRGIEVNNPSSTRSLYICFGTTSCSTDAIKVGPLRDKIFDLVQYGWGTSTTTIYGRLDSGGSVTPEVTVW